MRNNKGISMITLIITIIVMIILAAIAFMAAGDQVGSAQFSKFASEFGEYATNFANAPVAEVTEALGMSGKATNKAQKIYAAARDLDLKNFDAVLNGIIVPGGYTSPRFQTDIKDSTGSTVELASVTTPVYEIKSDVMKEYAGKQFYGDANGKETHWVTSKGVVFTLPGYPRNVDGEERMYITADLYYLAGSGDMITADDLVPVEPVKVGGDVVTGNQKVEDAADSVTPGEGGNIGGEEEEEEIPDFSDQTTIEGCPLKFGRAYVNVELSMALLPFADGGALVGLPAWGWVTGNVEYLPAGSLTYSGSEIVLEGTVIATCNESGTEAYYDGYTFTLEPVLLGTNDYCSHSIIRSEAMHYVQTYIKNQSEKYTGDTYCIYCNELVDEGECKHINTEIQNAKEATCTEDGYTGESYCLDCNNLIKSGEIVPAHHNEINGICTKCDLAIIPYGATYKIYGGETLVAGEAFPETAVKGDEYRYGDYTYAYLQRWWSGGWYNALSTGWGVHANENKNSYGEILSKINGYDVTSMQMAFEDKTALIDASSIKIPNTITDMGYAFEGCTNLKIGAIVPKSVTNMSATYKSCSSLVSVPDMSHATNLTNMQSTFNECTALKTTPILPSSVISMDKAFYGCTSLTTITHFPSNLQDMSQTFLYCKSLVTVPEIPSSVTSMWCTFEGCVSLTIAPIIPETVIQSVQYTFKECTSLTGVVTINANPKFYTDCFKGVDFASQGLTLSGSSPILDAFGATGINYCTTCNGKCNGEH